MAVEHGIIPICTADRDRQRPRLPLRRHGLKHVATAYGPLYTLISYPLARSGVVGAIWAMKLEALLASAGIFGPSGLHAERGLICGPC